MSDNSAIEWTDASWNPVTGCNKISPGCKLCYAERMVPRLMAMKNPRYKNGFRVTLHHDLLNLPSRWKKPRKIFVNSMSDLFHETVPFDFILRVFEEIDRCRRHTFQVLTKRPETALDMSPDLPWPPNLLMGVSVENQDYVHRIDTLRQIPGQFRFLSMEPLLSATPDLNLEDIHWLIAGGESGPGARPVDVEWIRDLRDQCQAADIPFFFKQWGGVQKRKHGRELDGRTWDETPSLPPPEPASAPAPALTLL